MSDQAAAGGENEGSPSLGDVRFDGNELLTFDGTSWVPLARAADTGPGGDIFRLGPGAASSEIAGDRDQAPGAAGNDSTGR